MSYQTHGFFVSLFLVYTSALTCYDCSQSTVRACNALDNLNVIKCYMPNSSCFTGITTRGCLTNCTNRDGNNITVCCNSDLCNNITVPVSSTTSVPKISTTNHSTRGIDCYFCTQDTEERCLVNQQNINLQRVVRTTCNFDEVCTVRVQKVLGDINSFLRGCFPKSGCQDSDDCNGQFGGDCIRCCDCDLCNNKDAQTAVSCLADSKPTSQPCVSSTPTPQSSASDHDILVTFLVGCTCTTILVIF